MKKIITLLVGIVFWGSGFSQSTFQNMYFNNYLSNGKYLTLGTDGNIVIAGEYITLSMNYWNLFIYKLNNTGDTLWTKLIGDTTGQGPEDILTTSDGGYFITGITKGNTPLLADVLALKLDSSGNVVWVKSIGGVAADVGSGACTTSDGGFCIAGSCSGATPDAYLVRLDGNGNLLWAKSYRELGNSSETFRDVRQTTDGGFIVVGWSGINIYVVKTDGGGTLDWARHMHIPVGTASDQAYSVLQTVDGGYLISGTTQNFGAGANDVFLMKTDSLGSILWSRTYGGSSNDYPHSLIVTADGGYAISGYSSSFTNGNDDIYIIKTNAIGDTLWTRIYGSANQESAKSIRQTSDGGYVVCGKSNSFSVYGAYVVKTNSNASMSCNEGNPATGMGYPSWNNNAASPIVASFGTSYPLSFTTSSGTMINNLCLTTSTDRDESNISFSLSPNPATTEIRIENKTKIESIEIYDVLGIRCQLLVVSGQSSVAQQLSTDTYPLTVDVSKLSPGIYFVKVKTEKGESAAKFVKQ